MQLLLSRQQAKEHGGTDHDKLQGDALDACLMLLEDQEPRVRLAVSECMRLLAELQGTAVWLKSREAILDSIRACWVRACPFRHQNMRPSTHAHCCDQLMHLLADQQRTAVWLSSCGAIPACISACWLPACSFWPEQRPFAACAEHGVQSHRSESLYSKFTTGLERMRPWRFQYR